ncbi:MAG: DUF1003 domain-containing protein [Vulcanimicrobiaceae bacterium]
MSDAQDRILPTHVEQTVEAIARLYADHERGATAGQRVVAKTTAIIGRAAALGVLTALIAAWVIWNVVAAHFGRAVDPPPFSWMQIALSVTSIYVTMLILGTQRRDDVIASYREQLSLQLAMLGEQKSAKIIELLEALRHDNPMIDDRVDAEALAMSTPADPHEVLEAIQESTGDQRDLKR